MINLLLSPITLLAVIYQSVFLAMSQIWANKLRSVLTTIGIVIGVASVTAVIAALTGLQTAVLSEFEAFGTNKIFINPDWRQTRSRNVPWQRIRFQKQHFEGLLEHCPSIGRYTLMNGMYSQNVAYSGRTESGIQVQGVEPDWLKIENRSLVMGRPFSLIDMDQSRPVCLVSSKTVQTMNMPTDSIGDTILVGKTRFTVIGIIEDRPTSGMFGENQASLEIVVPFTTVSRLNPYSNVSAMAACKTTDLSEEAQAELRFFLRRTRRIRPDEPDTFRIDAVEQFVKQFRRVAAMITMAASGVVGISLLVGGVGIMNIMLVSVSERTREIGLRKAVGARPSAVLLQFLVEAVVLCCVGGAMGLAAGQGMTLIMKNIPQANLQQAHIPLWAVGLAFGFSAGVGLVFGMFPAIKAARLNPIDALRHE